MRFQTILFCFAVLGLSQPGSSAELTVFAAASLTDAMKEAARAHEKDSGDRIVLNSGASSTLSRQIIEGAPADVFFSADAAQMNALEERGLILPGTRSDRLSNTLVVITIDDSTLALRGAADLAGPSVKRLALANPKTVPAGVYSRNYLEQKNLWPRIEPKVIPTDNVRAAVAAVESGNVDAGIVFRTDAAAARRVKVAFEVPADEGPLIRYPLAVIRGTKQPEAAKRFLDYLNSPDAGKIFERHGFIVLHER